MIGLALLVGASLIGCDDIEYSACLSPVGRAVSTKIVNKYWISDRINDPLFVSELTRWARDNTEGEERAAWLCWCEYYAIAAAKDAAEKTAAATLHSPPL